MKLIICKPEKLIFKRVMILVDGIYQNGKTGHVVRYAYHYKTKQFSGYVVAYQHGYKLEESVFNRNQLAILS